MCSPYQYWQFWRNTEDADVGRFLRMFTDMKEEEVARLEALQGGEINEAKKILATAATTILHGKDAAEAAAETARRTFEEGAVGEGLPTVEIEIASPLFAINGLSLASVMAAAGLATSNSDARRLIKGGGARVNDVVIQDEKHMLVPDRDIRDGMIKLSAGRKKHAIVRLK
jgi:tyrosyl-tRNA synthetase